MAKSVGGNSSQTSSSPKKMTRWLKLSLVAGGMSIVVIFVALVLLVKASERSEIDDQMDEWTSTNYGGVVEQSAPKLNAVPSSSMVYEDMTKERGEMSVAIAKQFVQNTNLKSTDGDVVVKVDLRKRGLRFEPTFKTEFSAKYVLENTSDEKVAVQFEFPFPDNVQSKEINNARLLVDGVEQEKPVRREEVVTSNYDEFGDYYEEEVTYKTGLYWEGKIAANDEKEIKVEYNTVGLARFSYEGIENPEGSQDFNFDMKIVGSRKYDNEGGLSIDEKEYITEDGENGVILKWDKSDLFSKPDVQVEVATRVQPSTHLQEIYKIMVPLYFAFAGALIIMVLIMKKEFGGVDMMITAALFTVFFPFLHYLVSFNIDPSADVLAGYSGIVEFTMPLYAAFAIALGVVGGLIVYLIGRVSGAKFAFGVGLPLVVVFMAFFPLAMTLPEYKYLLALIGVVAILAVIVQMRAKKRITKMEQV